MENGKYNTVLSFHHYQICLHCNAMQQCIGGIKLLQIFLYSLRGVLRLLEDAVGAGHAGPEAPDLPPHGGEAVGRGGLDQPALTVQLGDGGVAGDLAQRVGLL